ncbi:MAG: hypothetical protein ACM359_09280 [Bacillota bacterium]
MITTDYRNPDDRLDRAISNRLAQLRTLPVDTSRLEARLRQHIPQWAEPRNYRFLLLRPLRAAAAGFVILGMILAAIISSSSGPALASADKLAMAHDEMVSGRSHQMRVSSIEAASDALSREWSQAPALPDMPDEHVMACCVHEVGRKKMACVSLKVDNVPITMAVADSADVRVPESKTIQASGVSWHVNSSKGVNMAMTERGGRWVCLMGRLSVDRLIDVGGQLRF